MQRNEQTKIEYIFYFSVTDCNRINRNLHISSVYKQILHQKSVTSARCTWRSINNAKWLNASAAQDASIPLELISSMLLGPAMVSAWHASSPALLPLCPRFSAMMSFSGPITWLHVCVPLLFSWAEVGVCLLLCLSVLFEELKMPEWSFFKSDVSSMWHDGCSKALDSRIDQGPSAQFFCRYNKICLESLPF